MSFSSDNPQIINQVQITVNLPDLDNKKLFQERLEYILKTMANSINSKEGGLYTLAETGSSEQYYIQGNPQKFRNVYRKVMDFVEENGADIPASGSVNFAHGISSVVESGRIYANCTATDGRRFTVVFPDVWIDATNAYFVNPVAFDLTQCDIIIQVLKEV
jgi:hypothetical protein